MIQKFQTIYRNGSRMNSILTWMHCNTRNRAASSFALIYMNRLIRDFKTNFSYGCTKANIGAFTLMKRMRSSAERIRLSIFRRFSHAEENEVYPLLLRLNDQDEYLFCYCRKASISMCSVSIINPTGPLYERSQELMKTSKRG